MRARQGRVKVKKPTCESSSFFCSGDMPRKVETSKPAFLPLRRPPSLPGLLSVGGRGASLLARLVAANAGPLHEADRAACFDQQLERFISRVCLHQSDQQDT
jgi:hypothetical protein